MCVCVCVCVCVWLVPLLECRFHEDSINVLFTHHFIPNASCIWYQVGIQYVFLQSMIRRKNKLLRTVWMVFLSGKGKRNTLLCAWKFKEAHGVFCPTWLAKLLVNLSFIVLLMREVVREECLHSFKISTKGTSILRGRCFCSFSLGRKKKIPPFSTLGQCVENHCSGMH